MVMSKLLFAVCQLYYKKADFENLIPELLNDLDPNDEAQGLLQKEMSY